MFPQGPRPGDFLIGIDGGVDLCLRAGILPDLAVGDWDSLKSRARKLLLSWVPSISLPREKDRSDLYFALATVRELGIPEVVCLGLSGGRSDHHLAALFDLGEFAEKARKLKRLRVRAPDAESFFIRKEMGDVSLPVKKEGLFSVFAWGNPATGVRIRGGRFQPPGKKLLPSSHGLSNVARGQKTAVRVERGTLLVILPVLP